MKKLSNPYSDYPEYNCFGCSRKNPIGLHMEFQTDGEEVVSTWEPGKDFEGFMDVLHGGIQATMIDEIASWVVFTMLDTAGVTYQLHTKYRSPVHISKGSISLRARLEGQKHSIATIRVELFDGEGKLCTEGSVDYFTLGKDKAREVFHFPGKEAFFTE